MAADLLFVSAPLTAQPLELVFGGDARLTDLVFSQTTIAGASVNLVFGGLEAGTHPDQSIALVSTLPALGGSQAIVYGVPVVASSMLPFLTCNVGIQYQSQTQRPTVASVQASAQVAMNMETGIAAPEQHAARFEAGVQAAFSEAAFTEASTGIAFAQAQRLDQAVNAPAQDGITMGGRLHAAWQDGLSDRRPQTSGLFKDAAGAQNPTLRPRFQDCLHDRRNWARGRFSEAAKRPATRYRGHAGAGVSRSKGWAGRFQDAWVPRPGVHAPVVPPVVPVPYWGTHLVFVAPFSANLNLLFQSDGTPTGVSEFQILPARFYMTAHTIYAQRLPDLADIPIYEATVAADSGSYCWSLSASGPASLFALLAPVDGLPAQLRITLDGIPFVFAVDAMSRNQKFGQTGVSISGRSVTALIGAPYLRATTRDNAGGALLAQQLAVDALQYSGVALDWGLVDWTVSAGAWSHQGTPLDAVQAIAQAAGGYLQSHRSAATLLTRHPYAQRSGDLPGAPWGWATGAADVELAQDAVITDGTERRDGPDINAVYVSGTTQGVLALVKRTGTAADKLANMVTDPLITHVDAARQRGLAILGAAGHKYHVVLELPVLTGSGQPGVIDVGQLVQVNAATPWRGRVRAVSVAAKRPSLRQTITLERHLETA